MLSFSPIGVVAAPEDGVDPDAGPALITLDKRFAPALDGLAGFSHVVVLWWADRADGTERNELIQPVPYRAGPDRQGVFATRAPGRPNPIGLSVCRLLAMDTAACTFTLDYLDALPGTPVLDLKPYTPSLDRVEDPAVPNWCASWPRSLEESGRFDWSTVFWSRFRTACDSAATLQFCRRVLLAAELLSGGCFGRVRAVEGDPGNSMPACPGSNDDVVADFASSRGHVGTSSAIGPRLRTVES